MGQQGRLREAKEEESEIIDKSDSFRLQTVSLRALPLFETFVRKGVSMYATETVILMRLENYDKGSRVLPDTSGNVKVFRKVVENQMFLKSPVKEVTIVIKDLKELFRNKVT